MSPLTQTKPQNSNLMSNSSTKKLLTGGALVLALAAVARADDTPVPPAAVKKAPAEPGTIDSIFNGDLPDAIGKSKINVNARLRWEHAEQDSITPAADKSPSDAFTLRTRFGITSGKLYGFQGMLEGENITVLGPRRNYNAAGSNGEGGKAIIADPPTTELNQAWLSYSNWDSVLKGGRQRIVLDNSRFVGDVGWRQNMQTFDAITFENKSIAKLDLYYGYLWQVNRVFGNVSGLPAANTDFNSDSHLFHLAYDACQFAKLVGYGYLLDFSNSGGNSCETFGGSVTGGYTFDKAKNLKANYRAEFAWQSDYKNAPVAYDTEYYNLEAGGEVRWFAFGGGYEVLGDDNGVGFKTPLATLHAFNGWDDLFLNTPPKGLQDIYGYLQVTLLAAIPLRFVYHKFDANSGGADFGQEFDVVISKKLGKYWNALAKYGYYDGKDAFAAASPAVDVQKVWLQLEFNF